MISIILTGCFVGKAAFKHVIQVPKTMIAKPGYEKVVGLEYLLQQYPHSSFSSLQNFKAMVA